MAGPIPRLTSEQEALRTERPTAIRVLLAEDPIMSCQMLQSALMHSRSRFDVVASTISQRDAVEFLSKRTVDVALVGESLAEGQYAGFQLLKELQAITPTVRAVMLLKSVSQDLVVNSFRGGAKGVICRTEPIRALYKCIQAVHKGQIWANTAQLHFLVEALIHSAPTRVTNLKGEYLLTEKEDEIALLVAEGMTNREVARKLEISEHTVSNYLFRIYEKLGISSRVELALYVIRLKQG